MDAALQPTTRRLDSPLHAVPPPPTPPSTEGARTLTVAADYRLSQAGQKAALLTGDDGRAEQHVTLAVPATRLHLVRVTARGMAHLKLRPQFRLNAEQRIVRVNARPVYDHPPTLDELLQDAARNHELEHAFYGQQATTNTGRREAHLQWLEETAQEFLADPTRRAILHPAPTARQCAIQTTKGLVHFDVHRNAGVARQVPPDALRRFQNDRRIRQGQAVIQCEHDVAVQAERREAMEAWILAHGTPDQRERLAAGVLPRSEWLAAVADIAFAPVAGLPIYDANGARCLQAFLRERPAFASAVVTHDDLVVATKPLAAATPVQWAWFQHMRRAFPHADVKLRERELSWSRDRQAPHHRSVAIVVTIREGVIKLRREFAVPDTAPEVPERTKEEACVSA